MLASFAASVVFKTFTSDRSWIDLFTKKQFFNGNSGDLCSVDGVIFLLFFNDELT